MPFKTDKSYKGLKGTQFTLKSWFRVISGVLAILIVSVSVLDCVPLLLLLFEIYTFKRRSAVVDNYFFIPSGTYI